MFCSRWLSFPFLVSSAWIVCAMSSILSGGAWAMMLLAPFVDNQLWLKLFPAASASAVVVSVLLDGSLQILNLLHDLTAHPVINPPRQPPDILHAENVTDQLHGVSRPNVLEHKLPNDPLVLGCRLFFLKDRIDLLQINDRVHRLDAVR